MKGLQRHLTRRQRPDLRDRPIAIRDDNGLALLHLLDDPTKMVFRGGNISNFHMSKLAILVDLSRKGI
jgi:hypothetical protein